MQCDMTYELLLLYLLSIYSTIKNIITSYILSVKKMPFPYELACGLHMYIGFWVFILSCSSRKQLISAGRMYVLGMKPKLLSPCVICILEMLRCMRSFRVISQLLGKWQTFQYANRPTYTSVRMVPEFHSTVQFLPEVSVNPFSSSVPLISFTHPPLDLYEYPVCLRLPGSTYIPLYGLNAKYRMVSKTGEEI